MQPGIRPEVGQIITIFRSRLRPEHRSSYDDHAAQMSALAATMPGYVEHKSFTADDGERVTVVTFADRAGHDGWRTQVDHRGAQRAGRESYYSSYSLQVGAVDHASHFVSSSTTD